MNKAFTPLAVAVLAAGLLGASAQAKTAPKAKMVAVYQAEKCHMYFTAAQYKKFKGACPDSHGKMHKVMVTPAVAAKGLAATNAALAPKSAAKKAM